MELTRNDIEVVIDVVPQLGESLTNRGERASPPIPEDRYFQEAEGNMLAPDSPSDARGPNQ